MGIALTEEQQDLAASVRDFTARSAPVAQTRAAHPELADGVLPAVWPSVPAQGYLGLHLPTVLTSLAVARFGPAALLPPFADGAAAVTCLPAAVELVLDTVTLLQGQVADGLRARLGGLADVSADGPRLFVYAQTEALAGEAAQAALDLARLTTEQAPGAHVHVARNTGTGMQGVDGRCRGPDRG